MKHFRLMVLGFIVLLCSSCAEYKNIRVSEPEVRSVKIAGLSSIDIRSAIDVENPTRQKFTIEKIDGQITKGEKTFAVISLKEAECIPARFDGEVGFVCTLKVLDVLELFVNGLNLETWSTDEFWIKGHVTVSSSNGLRKTFRLKKSQLTDVLGKDFKLK